MEKVATVINLGSVIEHQARLTPGKEAVIWQQTRLTYGQLNAYANRVAGGLRELGIKPGDKIALSCPNLPYFPIAFFGALKAGAVVVPLNVLCKPREVAYFLRDSDAKAVLVFEGTPELPLGQTVKAGFDEVETCEHLIVITANPASPSPIEGTKSLGQIMATQSDKFATEPTKPDDTAIILYTSGTTGQPKGAELTHSNIYFNALASANLLISAVEKPDNEQKVCLISLPLFHVTALTTQLVAAMVYGNKVVLIPRFEVQSVLDAFVKEKVQFWTGVPTMYWAILNYIEENGTDIAPIAENLSVLASGGAPMPVELMNKFEETFGVRILEGYGLSETSPLATFNHPQRPSKAGTVGQPISGVEVRVVDDNDQEVPAGERGEIVIRGHNVMKGYYKRPEATAEAMRNGWFHTGDIGVYDEEGYLSIVDRKKDMILRGGYNVYPRELEEVLMTHEAVSLCAVIGVPDEKLGEEVKAIIVRNAGFSDFTEEKMLAWCKENIASNKYPRIIEFRDELPVGATGKVLKRELRG